MSKSYFEIDVDAMVTVDLVDVVLDVNFDFNFFTAKLATSA